MLGVGYLTEFANGICVDSGNASVGNKILIAGKVIIFCLALPIITNLLDIIVGFGCCGLGDISYGYFFA